MKRDKLEYIWRRIYFYIKDYLSQEERIYLLGIDDGDLAAINDFVKDAIASLPDQEKA